jgi:serine protease Do
MNRSVAPASAPLLVIGLAGLLLAALPVHAALTPDDLKATESKVRSLCERALPCTVSLIPAGPAAVHGSGSGVVVREDGLILTAAHVVMDMNGKVRVLFPDGKRAEAEVLGIDFSRDAAMIRIVSGGTFPFVEVGESGRWAPDDWCVALGHANGFQPDRTPPIRLGRVLQNDPEGFLTTDCALIGGDSGGPLFDLEGKVIGIHSNIGFSLSTNNHVPIDVFRRNWDRLLAGSRIGGNQPGDFLQDPERPVIGAVLADAGGDGVQVERIFPKSPAARSGLREGDVIVEIDGSPVGTADEAIARIGQRKAGDVLRIKRKPLAEGGPNPEVSVKLAPARSLGASPGPERRRERETDRAPRPAGPASERQASPSVEPPDALEDEFIRDVWAALLPSVETASRSTLPIFRGDERKGLGTVVHEDGWVLAKASELEARDPRPLAVMLGLKDLRPATITKIWPQHDLALLRVTGAPELVPVRWPEGNGPMPLGSFLVAPGPGPDPLGLGVVSVAPRSLGSGSKGFLGILMAPHEDGVKIVRLVEAGNARQAGLRPGDIITGVNGSAAGTPEQLQAAIAGTAPGGVVAIAYLRDGRPQTKKVRLVDRNKLPEEAMMGNRADRMNRMGTDVSRDRTGYPNALQTDLPIRPEDCGGPLVDLAGELVGINIARAGRTHTYVLPAADIRALLRPELEGLRARAPEESPGAEDRPSALAPREP